MNIRLIKAGIARPDDKGKKPPAEVPIIDTIRSWVSDFQSARADRVRRDFKQISNAGKI
jgi:hypothetical protein